MVAKLLIANRGEIACRIIRTARAMGIATVAVYSDADRRALHVEHADEAVSLGGLTPNESYLRTDALVAAANGAGADAVHPGYGFLAENAAFARACVDAGLVFVGPRPETIAAMGDKLEAKALMSRAGVPVLRALRLPTGGLARRGGAEGMDYPVLVKAARGGGGKGMRVVRSPADLSDALDAARRESAAAFRDDTVFMEPLVERARHVEVQIVGDDHGTVAHLGERECSIQRRHQKIIEESPCPALDEDLREGLCEAAVAAARALEYTSAGTVEFILSPDGSFYFLEVNTRLQVEHPVTEAAWRLGDQPIDLVHLQLLVAGGAPLPFAQDDLRLHAHAIEARLYAEDPANEFLPSAGTLEVFVPAGEQDGVRWDSGVRSGDEVSIHYDPLLAKVVAAGSTRRAAAARLAAALERSRIHGTITNRDFLVRVLRHDAFVAGEVHTGFVEEHVPPAVRAASADPHVAAVHAAVAALAAARRRHRGQQVLATVPPAWRNNPSRPQDVTYRVGDADVCVTYAPRRDGTWIVSAGDESFGVRVIAWPDERPDGCLDVEIGSHRLRITVDARGRATYVDSPLGHSRLDEHPRFPDPIAHEVAGGLVAPMPGTVVSVLVDEGDRVEQGSLLMLVEAMKMEGRMTAPCAGTVSQVRVGPGDGVAAGDVLVVIDEDGEAT